MKYSLITTAIQIDFQDILQFTIVAILGIVILGFLYRFFCCQSDKAPDNTRIAVKIDRRGNYRYERVPDEDNQSITWIQIAIVLIALALLFIPLNSLINRS
jgi:H+/gluconate symporter-like permease